jgi:hypothetical protein
MYISEDKIAAYLFKGLIARGYVPTADEVWVLAELIFDFLLETGIIGEVDGDET